MDDIVDNTEDWSNPSDQKLLGTTANGSTPFGDLGKNINSTWNNAKQGNVLGTLADIKTIKNNPFGHPFGTADDGSPSHPPTDHPMFAPDSSYLSAPDSNGIRRLTDDGQKFIQTPATQAPVIDNTIPDIPDTGTGAIKGSSSTGKQVASKAIGAFL